MRLSVFGIPKVLVIVAGLLCAVGIFAFLSVDNALASTSYGSNSQNFGSCPPPPDDPQTPCITISTNGGFSDGLQGTVTFSASGRIASQDPGGTPYVCPTISYTGNAGIYNSEPGSGWDSSVGCSNSIFDNGPLPGGDTVFLAAADPDAGDVTWTVSFPGEPNQVCMTIDWDSYSLSPFFGGSTTICSSGTGAGASMNVSTPSGPNSVNVGGSGTYSSDFTWTGASATWDLELFNPSGVRVGSCSGSLTGSPQTKSCTFNQFLTAGTYQVCATGTATAGVGFDVPDTACRSVNAAFVDLYANGVKHAFIDQGDSASMTWTSGGVSSCGSSQDPNNPAFIGGWPNPPANSQPLIEPNGLSVGPFSTPGDYELSLTCNPTSNVTITVQSTASPPSTPTNLTASPRCVGGGPGIFVDWSHPGGSNIAYRIYRNGSLRTTVSGTTAYTDTSVTAGQTYSYYVIAYDTSTGVSSSQSNTDSAVAPNNCAPAIPPAPTNLNAAGQCSGGTAEILVSWTHSPGATGYRVYIDCSFADTNVGYVDSWIHTGLSPGSIHTYEVEAYNGSGSSPKAGPVSGTAPNNCAGTLGVDLNVAQDGVNWQNSLSGSAPYNGIDLQATVSGTASGLINYTFYCNRADTGTNVTSPWDAKFNNVANTLQNIFDLCDYPTPGNYTAKVIAERGTLAAEDRATITVSSPPNGDPSAANLSVTDGDQCTAPLQPTLSWTFSDPDGGDSQSAYQLQIDASPFFSSPDHDTGQVTSASNSYTVPLGVLNFNTTYYWRVRVWDQNGGVSNYAAGPSFTTQVHAAPDPDFTWLPTNPAIGEQVDFTNQTQFFGGAGADDWDWDFTGGSPGSSGAQHPNNIRFNSPGQHPVTLTATDDDGLFCSTTQNVSVTELIPRFREIIP